MMNNPYIHRGPVIGEAFFGRKDEFARILQLLGAFQPQDIAIHGPERIGKSSLLRELCEIVGPKELSKLTFKYIDMQGLPDPESFLQQASDRRAEDYDGFREWLEARTQPIIFCLDEFGKTVANEEFDVDFFDYLRSIAGSGRAVLITSTLSALPDLAVPPPPRVSRFFNIFTPLPLGPLTDVEARQLVMEPAQRVGLAFTPEEIAYAVRVTSGHPFHLQLFCYRLFEAKHEAADTKLDLAQVTREYQTDLMQIKPRPQPPEAPAFSPTSYPLPKRWEQISQTVFGGLALIIAITFLVAFIANSPQFLVVATIVSMLALLVLGIGALALARRPR